jgi:hypothetical protein
MDLVSLFLLGVITQEIPPDPNGEEKTVFLLDNEIQLSHP